MKDEKNIATTFAKHYCSLSSNQANGGSITQRGTRPLKSLCNSFVWYEVTPGEIQEIIRKCKLKNSSGLDSISIKIFKILSAEVSEPIAKISNLMFENGKFPQSMKEGVIVPIYKKNDPTRIENYRPVTILNVMSKILERVIYNRLLKFLNKFEILNKVQHGFRCNRSTESAAFVFVEEIYKRVDEGRFVAGLFFDLTRAFDCLDINFLLKKLEAWGFRGQIIRLLESYLNFRKCCVRIGASCSDFFNIDVGVPQGSVLGPLLFLLFVNEITDHLDEGLIVMFADDTSVLVTARTPEELQATVIRVIDKFKHWCVENRLSLNMDKSISVNFRSYRAENILQIDNLESSNNVKFLGLYLDEHLTWHKHIDYVSSKVSSGFFALSRLRGILDSGELLNVYFSLVYSHLSYNVCWWGNSTASSRLFVAQKRIIRLIFDLSHHTSCRETFVANKILTLPCIYILKTLCFIHENVEMFNTGSICHSYNTRNRKLLLAEKHRLALFEKSPVYTGKKIYNKLSPSIKKLPMKRFKHTIKTMLADQACYSVKEFLRFLDAPYRDSGS